ncbi:hypothetical protein KAU15_00935, partial [candidate division WOR-3 bacterium]|nr:hypothetical protein [candidate division WOR-3 bacterium]
MKKLILLLCLIPLLIFGFSPDRDIPDLNISFETYPFFLETMYLQKLCVFDEMIISDNEVILSDRMLLKTNYYDYDYNIMFRDVRTERTYITEEYSNDLNYGIGFINSNLRNRIYASLYYKDNDYYLRSHTMVSMINENPYDYKNRLHFKYKNVLLMSDIDRDKYNILMGYSSENGYIVGGYDNDRILPVRISLSIKGMHLSGTIEYDIDSKDHKEDITIMYPIRFNKFTFVPMFLYNDEVKIAAGLLYRIVPMVSSFINYSGYTENIVECGLRFTNRNIFSDIAVMIEADSMQYTLKTSMGAKYNYIMFNGICSYKDEFEFNINSFIEKSFFNGNLIPGIFVSYNDNNELYSAIITK